MVELFKKKSTYKDDQGNEKTAVNFYVRCGDVLIPVQVRYFENKETGTDEHYRERKSILSAFASDLPEKKQGD